MVDLFQSELLMEAKDYLSHQNTAYLATTGSAGLRVSPVTIFLNDEMGIFLHCFGGDKLINIRENPEVCLLVVDDKWTLDPGLYEGVQVFGTVTEIMPDTNEYEAIEIWCPYEHSPEMTLIELTPKKMVIVDYIDDQKRKRALEL